MSDMEMEPQTGNEESKSGFLTSIASNFRQKDQRKPEKKKKTWKQELMEWIVTLAVALVIAFVVRSFIFEPVYVDGNSMYPTLHHGEIMYVSKTSYGTSFFGVPFTSIGKHFTVGGEPERFDVVVCNYPNRVDEKGVRINFVKRVVGLPGDTIEIKSGYLYVNGERIPEKFLHERMVSDWPSVQFRIAFMNGEPGPYTVPEGHYFLMGDNRNSSNDSRAWNVGPVTRDMIVGRVEAVLWHPVPGTLEDSGLKVY